MPISADDLRTLGYQLNELCHECIPLTDDNRHLFELLGRAASHVFEAAKLADHPGMQPVNCITSGFGTHACGDTPYSTLCGAKFDIMQSVVSSKTIPDCPDCLAMLQRS